MNDEVMKRTDWDAYFLTIAYLVSMRSIDTSTKCGAVLVSKDNRILSTGYNGPIRGMNDVEVPMTRPIKYYYMVHSEMNALLAYNGSYNDIQGATCYVTGEPCHDCLRSLLQKGVKRIVYSDSNLAFMSKNKEDELIKARQDMIKQTNAEIVIIPYQKILDVLTKTTDSIAQRATKEGL